MFFSRPLVYTISVLLPASYLIGLIFTLKTHSHIYDIHVSDGHRGQSHGQYAQEAANINSPTGEVTAANMCINASIVAPRRFLTGVWGACGSLHERTFNPFCMLHAQLTMRI